jgi:dihydrofolate reductase
MPAAPSRWKAAAHEAAGGKDVRLGGGVATVRQYLQAQLIDEMHVALSPVLLGRGEALIAVLDLPGLGYSVREHAATPEAMHVIFERK